MSAAHGHDDRMHGALAQFVLRLLLTGVSVLVVGAILPGIKVKSYGSAVLFAFVVGILNAIAWYVLAPLTWTFAVLTLGIGILLINALVFLIGSRIVSGVKISGWVTALLASLGVSVCNWIVFWIAGGLMTH